MEFVLPKKMNTSVFVFLACFCKQKAMCSDPSIPTSRLGSGVSNEYWHGLSNGNTRIWLRSLVGEGLIARMRGVIPGLGVKITDAR
jgi:hypothetical protein